MEGQFRVRTDLALEEREKVQGSEIPGIRVREWEKEETGIRVTEVLVCDERGEEALGKPVDHEAVARQGGKTAGDVHEARRDVLPRRNLNRGKP